MPRFLPVSFSPISSICLILGLALSLAGCAAKTVSVVNETEFTIMAGRLAPLLREHGVLDGNNAYAVPLFASGDNSPAGVGESLFSRLSPAFRFKVDPSLLPPTFAASRGRDDTLELRRDGFVMDRGAERITVVLLAVVDWDRNGAGEWLLLCRVATPRTGGLLDYYLLIERPDVPVLQPRLLAAWDCRSGHCRLFVTAPGKKGKNELDPEDPVIEVEAGEHNVTLPPETRPHVPDKGGKGVREQRLGG